VTDRFELVVARPAARALAEDLPEAVAVAVIAFITGPLLDDPRRVGRELRRELAGARVARRGTYRVLYRVDDPHHEVVVVRVDHRRDIYRT
jgi:mRNA interferase RelE/StbE